MSVFVKRIQKRRILEGLMMLLLPLIIVVMKLSDAREYPKFSYSSTPQLGSLWETVCLPKTHGEMKKPGAEKCVYSTQDLGDELHVCRILMLPTFSEGLEAILERRSG